MNKILLLFAIFCWKTSNGQLVDEYNFEVENGAIYTPLTGAINLTSKPWGRYNYKVPLGFTTKIGGIATSYFAIGNWCLAPATDTQGFINTFLAYGAQLRDRSMVSSGASLSPIRYVIDGISPNRIFKLEYFNAGFEKEYDNHITLNDSVNIQVWLYETSNIVELRYGTSNVTYPTEYFDFEKNGPLIGFAKNYNPKITKWDKIYALCGTTSAPTIDSSLTMSEHPALLSNTPPNGTIYRFIPKTTSSSIATEKLKKSISVYPTVTNGTVNIQSNLSDEAKAEIFNVGDGKVLKYYIIKYGLNAIDISQKPNGIYIIRIKNNHQLFVDFKVIKQ